ncbi:hypothetical protein F4679DRAFT_584862 [Xylaria curta]|nr:hypothetical protein F4679DRAFT_584862 [Xylaria curta]
MSFPIALQSLLFYIASCTPCHQARTKYRMEQQAKRHREAKQRDNINRQGYQQPEPFSTNPYWAEEIRMGPHIDRKKYKPNGQQHVTGPGVVPSSLVPPNPTTKTTKTPATNPTNTNTTATNPTNAEAEASNTGTVNSASSWETMYADDYSATNTLNSVDTVIVHALNTSTTNTGTANTSTANTSLTNTGTFRTLFTSTSTGTVSSVQENEKPNVDVGRDNDIVNITTHKAPSPAVIEDEAYRLSPDTLPTALPINSHWNKRYQREDEELRSSEISRTGHKLMDAIKHAGSSAGRFIESSLAKDVKIETADEDEENCYFIPLNRPLNDYHPPIARRPPFKGKVSWMVQPPPPARLMEGKLRAGRDSSFSNPSRHATPVNGKETRLPISRGSSMELKRALNSGSSTSEPPLDEPELPVKPRSRRPRRPRRFWEPEGSSTRSGWDDHIRPRPRGRFVNNPDAYDTRVFVKRPEFRKDGKTFIRPRLLSDCMPPDPDGFSVYPVRDPIDSTYREELGIPRWTGSD